MPEPIDIANAGPPTLDHVIGQRQAVEQLRVSLAAYWAERAAGRSTTFGGVLMAGPPGTGKSTLARILASELGGTLTETLGQTLGMGDDLHAILLECTDDTVMFIDEAEQLPAFAQTTLYKAVEERVLLVPMPSVTHPQIAEALEVIYPSGYAQIGEGERIRAVWQYLRRSNAG
jgi:Holliday junction resolvasome RuvABC ATP-dependent DNA helicase subunit